VSDLKWDYIDLETWFPKEKQALQAKNGIILILKLSNAWL